MELENLKKSLVAEGSAEARKIVSQAEKQAEEILAQAAEASAKIRAEAKERARLAAEAESNERISSAQLKAKKTVTEARNRLLEESLSAMWDEFRKVTQTNEYEAMMKRLITGAEKELGEKAMVNVNSSDLKLAKKFSENVSQKPADIAGGAIVCTKDGSITIDNSLESIFENGKEEAKSAIFSTLTKEGK